MASKVLPIITPLMLRKVKVARMIFDAKRAQAMMLRPEDALPFRIAIEGRMVYDSDVDDDENP